MDGTFTNVAPVAKCPICGGDGVPWELKGEMVNMRCPGCFNQWTTISARCGNCYKPNGTAKPGFCKSCIKRSVAS